MFEALIDRIEQAASEPRELVRLRGVVGGAKVTAGERERLNGLIDRYEDDQRLAAEAAETALILLEEFGDEQGGRLVESFDAGQPRDPLGRWRRFRTFTDETAAREWAEGTFGPWARALRPAERRSLALYKDDGKRRFAVINGALRGQRTANALVTREAPRIQAALLRSRLPEPVVAWRAVPRAALPAQLDVGDALVDRAFMSTTLLRSVAEDGYAASRPDPVLLELRLPAGTPGGLVDLVGPRTADLELLLPSGAAARVDSVHGEGPVTRVVLELEGFDPADLVAGAS